MSDIMTRRVVRDEALSYVIVCLHFVFSNKPDKQTVIHISDGEISNIKKVYAVTILDNSNEKLRPPPPNDGKMGAFWFLRGFIIDSGTRGGVQFLFLFCPRLYIFI